MTGVLVSKAGPVTLQCDSESTIDQPEVVVDLTTEVRWFFDEPLPAGVLDWFTTDSLGLREDRSDTYRVDDPEEMGVKWRFGTTLELKLRLSPPEPFSIDRKRHGRLEIWRRWSPAGDRVTLLEDTGWIDVDKMIIKRRFDLEGHEVPLSQQNRAMEGEGCDCEVASVTVAGRPGWTVAFAAFGPLDFHRDAIYAAWNHLRATSNIPSELKLDEPDSMGYPEWLTKIAPPRPYQGRR